MNYKILIVDDSATTRAIIKRTIQMAKIPVERAYEAANGKIALALLAEHPVDLIIADLHMPVMDGVEMSRQILASPATRSIPVIIVTADPNPQRIAELQQQGVRAFLPKPFTPEAVRKVIDEVIGASLCPAH